VAKSFAFVGRGKRAPQALADGGRSIKLGRQLNSKNCKQSSQKRTNEILSAKEGGLVLRRKPSGKTQRRGRKWALS